VELWQRYHDKLEKLEQVGALRRPIVPEHCRSNGHIYYVLLPTAAAQVSMLAALRTSGVDAVFHYVPLHNSPAGRRFGRACGALEVTEDVPQRLIRLPLWSGMTNSHVDEVVEAIEHAMAQTSRK
jgi:dTDP-4-amino-4,6-dideoxygalactose transaminase